MSPVLSLIWTATELVYYRSRNCTPKSQLVWGFSCRASFLMLLIQLPHGSWFFQRGTTWIGLRANTQRQTTTHNLDWSVHLLSMSLDCGRKLECSEKPTHHRAAPFSPNSQQKRYLNSGGDTHTHTIMIADYVIMYVVCVCVMSISNNISHSSDRFNF